MPPVRFDSRPGATRAKAQPSPPCSICGAIVARASDLKRHQLVHQPRQFHCTRPGCLYSAPTAAGLKVHTDRHDGNVINCPEENCPYASHDPASLHRHRCKKHGYQPRKVAPKGRKVKDYVPPCVPAAVRRTVAAQEHGVPLGIYENFCRFPVSSTSSAVTTPAVVDTLDDMPPLTLLSSNSDSDSDSSRSASPTPSDSSSSSSDFSLPDIDTIRRENALRDARYVQPQ